MKQMVKNAQRILDECSEDHLHPANNRRYLFHQKALKAIADLEEKIMTLTDKKDKGYEVQRYENETQES
jgi:hypothetical protein